MGVFDILRGKEYRQEKREARSEKREAKKQATTPAEKQDAKEAYKDAVSELNSRYPADVSRLLVGVAPLRAAMELLLRKKGIAPLPQFVPLILQFSREILGIKNLPDISPENGSSFDPATIAAIASIIGKIIQYFKNRSEAKNEMPPEDRATEDRVEELTEEALKAADDAKNIKKAVDLAELFNQYKTEILISAAIAAAVYFGQEK